MFVDRKRWHEIVSVAVVFGVPIFDDDKYNVYAVAVMLGR